MTSRGFFGLLCVAAFLCLWAGSTVWAQGVVISEFLAVNDEIQDDDGDTSDWIELRNTSNEPVDLSGWFLTDSLDHLTMWAVPDGVILAENAYLVIWIRVYMMYLFLILSSMMDRNLSLLSRTPSERDFMGKHPN